MHIPPLSPFTPLFLGLTSKSSHLLTFPALTSVPSTSHLWSPHLTSGPHISPLVPTSHLWSPHLTSGPHISPQVPTSHLWSPHPPPPNWSPHLTSSSHTSPPVPKSPSPSFHLPSHTLLVFLNKLHIVSLSLSPVKNFCACVCMSPSQYEVPELHHTCRCACVCAYLGVCVFVCLFHPPPSLPPNQAMLRYKSTILHTASTLFYLVPLLFDFTEEKQYVSVVLFESYCEPYGDGTVLASMSILNPRIQLYSALLTIDANFSGFT